MCFFWKWWAVRQFCIFKMLPIIGWRKGGAISTYWQAPLGGLARGCRVKNRLQGFQAEASAFLKAGLETCYWWFKGQPIDMNHIPNLCAGFLKHHTNHPFLVSHTQPLKKHKANCWILFSTSKNHPTNTRPGFPPTWRKPTRPNTSAMVFWVHGAGPHKVLGAGQGFSGVPTFVSSWDLCGNF